MMPTGECGRRLILRLWNHQPSGRPMVLPPTSASTVDLAPAPLCASTTRRHGAPQLLESRAALATRSKGYFLSWPTCLPRSVPQTIRPAGWALYPKPSYRIPMVCGHLLSIPAKRTFRYRSATGAIVLRGPTHRPDLPAG